MRRNGVPVAASQHRVDTVFGVGGNGMTTEQRMSVDETRRGVMQYAESGHRDVSLM